MGVIGVILAGGQARRMGGGDKCLLELGGQSLLRRVMDRLTPQVDHIVLNANGDAGRFSVFDLPVVADGFGDFAGPLAGVLAGMDYAATQGATDIVTVAADTPFFPQDLVMHLHAARLQDGAAIALAATPDPERGMSRHPTFGLWPVALRAELRTGLEAGVRKVVAWADPQGCAVAEFPVGRMDPFFNVNTPQDLAMAEAFL